MPGITCVLFNPAVDHVIDVDDFHAGGTFKARHASSVPVGKAISVAIGLKALGHDPRVVALVGKQDSRWYQAFLDELGLRHELLPVDGATRRHLTIVDPVNRTTTHVREEGFHVHEGVIDAILDAIQPAPGGTLACAGSFPPGISGAGATRFINECAASGMTTFLDTSGDALRTIMAKDPPACLKINHQELASMASAGGDREEGGATTSMTPRDVQLVAASARALLGGNLATVAITLGKAGALLATSRGVLHGTIQDTVDPPVASTVGAGDAFLAGMIDGSIHGRDDASMLRHAIAVATASTRDRLPGRFNVDLVRSMLPRVAITPVEPAR